jgi:hypothetical protein
VLKLPQTVKVIEVGPRDGLQSFSRWVDTDTKVAMIDLLSDAGFPVIEATSFARSTVVPHLKDAELVLARIRRRPGTVYRALVPNARGAERAVASKLVDEVLGLITVSETYLLHNQNMSLDKAIAEGIRAFEIAARATSASRWRSAWRSGVRTRAGFRKRTPWPCCRASGPPESGASISPAASAWRIPGTCTRCSPLRSSATRGSSSATTRTTCRLRPCERAGRARRRRFVHRGLDLRRRWRHRHADQHGVGGQHPSEDIVHFLNARGYGTGLDTQRVLDCAREVAAPARHRADVVPGAQRHARRAAASARANMRSFTRNSSAHRALAQAFTGDKK